MSPGHPEHRVTIDVPYGTSNLWLQQQLEKYPGDARVSIEKETSYNNPTDPGGRVTVSLNWIEK